jgi:murein DD-endopeptidase MepM/ murein hydrolase activator NlpD
MSKNILIVLSFLFYVQVSAQSIFTLPIEGKYNEDWFIVNHVDEDTTNGFIDAFCGTKSYNGHYGTDFVIRNFNHMDAGVNILAPANGQVFVTKDGLFDRNKKSVIANGFGNYIGIKHTINGQNYYTYYAHLKKGSLKVDSGDMVTQGQVLAQVGSSGNSEDPHLHFEVYNDTIVLDPWDAPCQFTPNTTLWLNPPAYDTTFEIINYGAFQENFIPFLDTIREPDSIAAPETYPDFFQTNFDNKYRTVWFLAKGVRKDDIIEAKWLLQQNQKTFTYKADRDYWYFYFWDVVNQDTLATNLFWNDNVEFFLNGKSVLRFEADPFYSTSVPEISKYFSIAQTPNGLELRAVGTQEIQVVEGYTILGQKLKIKLEQNAADTWTIKRENPQQVVMLRIETNNGVFQYKWMPTF